MLIAWTSLMTYYASWGGFRHMAYLPIPTQKDVIFWNFPIQTLSILLFIPGKLSVAWLILRIIGPHMVWRRRVLLFLMVTVFLFNSLLAILLWVECRPIAAAWDYTIHGTCWSPGIKVKFGIFDSGEQTFMGSSSYTNGISLEYYGGHRFGTDASDHYLAAETTK